MEEDKRDEDKTPDDWKEEGWTIIEPKLVQDGKCEHEWVKQGENDYKCKKCMQGFIGELRG